jgi:hypothetical protein
MLNVQTYLLTNTLDELAKNHGVYARFSTQNPSKFSLNYDQLEAKDADPIAQECRGLVLRSENDVASNHVIVGPTHVLALPMRRFFNYGQGAAAPVDLDSPDTRFLEKLDGTLCILYWDRDLRKWCVATRSVPDADLMMDGFGGQTFTDLFWKAFAASGGMISQLDYAKGWHTFCFELCTPDNQIVVKYNDFKVYLLAARENDTGHNMDPEPWAKQISVEAAPTYKFGSTAEMLDFVSSRNPLAHEGIVVCDKDFNRVKVKNAGYLAYNKIKDSVAKSPRAVLEVILLGKEDDVFPLITERQQAIMIDVKEKLRVMLAGLDEEYARIYDADRKTFALAVQAGSGLLGPHMARWSGKCTSARDWVMNNRRNGTWPDGFLDSLLGMCHGN